MRRAGKPVKNKEFPHPEIHFPGSLRHIHTDAATAARTESTVMITLNVLPTALLLSCFVFIAAACLALLADEINQSRRKTVRDFDVFDVYTSLYRIQQKSQLGSRNKLKSTVHALADSRLSGAGPSATVQSIMPTPACASMQRNLPSLPRSAVAA
jgi:hypothetical protein